MSRLSVDLHKCLSDGVLNKLFKKEIFTTLKFMETESMVLKEITGLKFDQVVKVKNALIGKFASRARDGQLFSKVVEEKGYIISSGIKILDDVLGGGFKTGFLYEFNGPSGCGKSQLVMTIVANVVATSPPFKILYFDPKGDLFMERLTRILESRVKNVRDSLSPIIHTRSSDAYELVGELHHYIKATKTTEASAKMLIIDSMTFLFFHRHRDYCESTGLLSNISSLLQHIAVEFHMVVLITNLSTSWSSGDGEDLQKVALGKYWEHIPHARFTISKLARIMSLNVTKGHTIPDGTSLTLTITEDGVQ